MLIGLLARPCFGNSKMGSVVSSTTTTNTDNDQFQRQNKPFLTRRDISRLQPVDVVIFVAHPDDETLFAPGLIPYLARTHTRFQVIYATIGDGGWNRLTQSRDPKTMPAIRASELSNAFQQYQSPNPPLLLDYQDGHVSDSVQGVAKDASNILRRLRPKEVYTFGPGGMSNHPDHKAVGRAVRGEAHRVNPKIKVEEFIYTTEFISQLKQSLLLRDQMDRYDKVTRWWEPCASSANIEYKDITDADKAISGHVLKTAYRTQFTTGEMNAFAEAWQKSKGPTFKDASQ